MTYNGMVHMADVHTVDSMLIFFNLPPEAGSTKSLNQAVRQGSNSGIDWIRSVRSGNFPK